MWKSIPDSNYEVSSDGEIRHAPSGRLVSQRTDTTGRARVNIMVGPKGSKKMVTRLVRRLVGDAFVPKPPDEPGNQVVITHKEGAQPDTLKASELEWVTRQELARRNAA